MYEISSSSSGSKLWLGILAALWVSSSGMGALSGALNDVFNVKDRRPWWRQRLTSICLTLALGVLIISALLLVLAGSHLAEGIAGLYKFGSSFTTTWRILQWPIVLMFILLAFGLIYFFAPDRRNAKFRLITPGSVVGVSFWLFVSFKFYLQFFDSYSRTYGSLGAVIVLMLWLYLTGAAILFGGEVNAVIGEEIRRVESPSEEPKYEPPG